LNSVEDSKDKHSAADF